MAAGALCDELGWDQVGSGKGRSSETIARVMWALRGDVDPLVQEDARDGKGHEEIDSWRIETQSLSVQ